MSKQFIKISEFRRWLEEHDQSKELLFTDYYGTPLTVNEYQVGVQVGDSGEAQEYAIRVILDVVEGEGKFCSACAATLQRENENE